MLQHHQKSFDLLSLKPQIFEELLSLLNNIEQQHGFSIPASLKEWYSIKNAAAILDEVTSPPPAFLRAYLPKEWCEVDQFWLHDLLNDGFLLILSEHAGIYHFAIKLDGLDNPPVFFKTDNYDWQLYSKSFSEFIYELICKYFSHLTLNAYTQTLTEQDLLDLNSLFLQLPIFTNIEGNKVYRFHNESKYIEIRVGNKCFDWYLSADSPETLFNLASQIWEFGYRLNYLFVPEWDFCCINRTVEKQVLAKIKLAGKLEKEVSYIEERQECSDKKPYGILYPGGERHFVDEEYWKKRCNEKNENDDEIPF